MNPIDNRELTIAYIGIVTVAMILGILGGLIVVALL